MSRPSQRIVVVGASGFIGTALVQRLLADGRDVTAISRSIDSAWTDRLLANRPANGRLIVRRGDVRDHAFLMECVGGAQTLFYLAVDHPDHRGQSDFDLITRNVEAALGAAAWIAEADLRSIVWVSSALVYGTESLEPRSEDAPLRPRDAYAAAKAAGEAIAYGAARIGGQAITIVRPFNCYGPGQSNLSFFGRVLSAVKAGKDIHLNHLDSVRDFVYVDDVVEGLLRAADRDSDQDLVVNLGTGVPTALADAIATFQLVAARDYRILIEGGEPPSRIDHLVADCRRAAATLGWLPRDTLASGLRKLLVEAGIECRP